jgi:hypothetical protein
MIRRSKSIRTIFILIPNSLNVNMMFCPWGKYLIPSNHQFNIFSVISTQMKWQFWWEYSCLYDFAKMKWQFLRSHQMQLYKLRLIINLSLIVSRHNRLEKQCEVASHSWIWVQSRQIRASSKGESAQSPARIIIDSPDSWQKKTKTWDVDGVVIGLNEPLFASTKKMKLMICPPPFFYNGQHSYKILTQWFYSMTC